MCVFALRELAVNITAACARGADVRRPRIAGSQTGPPESEQGRGRGAGTRPRHPEPRRAACRCPQHWLLRHGRSSPEQMALMRAMQRRLTWKAGGPSGRPRGPWPVPGTVPFNPAVGTMPTFQGTGQWQRRRPESGKRYTRTVAGSGPALRRGFAGGAGRVGGTPAPAWRAAARPHTRPSLTAGSGACLSVGARSPSRIQLLDVPWAGGRGHPGALARQGGFGRPGPSLALPAAPPSPWASGGRPAWPGLIIMTIIRNSCGDALEHPV